MGLMDRDIYRGFPENFGSRSHDNAGSKFDKHPISIDFTGYKNTNKLILFRAFLTLNLVGRLFVSNIHTSVASEFTDHFP